MRRTKDWQTVGEWPPCSLAGGHEEGGGLEGTGMHCVSCGQGGTRETQEGSRNCEVTFRLVYHAKEIARHFCAEIFDPREKYIFRIHPSREPRIFLDCHFYFFLFFLYIRFSDLVRNRVLFHPRRGRSPRGRR